MPLHGAEKKALRVVSQLTKSAAELLTVQFGGLLEVSGSRRGRRIAGELVHCILVSKKYHPVDLLEG